MIKEKNVKRMRPEMLRLAQCWIILQARVPITLLRALMAKLFGMADLSISTEHNDLGDERNK